MAKKIRKQTLALKSYLDKVKEEDISDSQDVQRKFCWDNNAVNELVVTVLTDDYIPPIILGEEELGDGVVQQYIVDGMQRSSSLILFRYGNYKITTAIENSVVEYQEKKIENGQVCRDDDGNVIWESKEFDIKKKNYDELPKALQRKFDDYQIEISIHQDCTMEMISKLVRRYNNHKSMNAVQKAFTYIDNYARKIRNIVELDFFKDCGDYPEVERPKGTYERVTMESVMLMFHLDKWKKTPKDIGKFLNENSSDEEFDTLKNLLNRLERIVDDKYQDIFNIKDSFIWFTHFYRFTKLGVDDSRFVEFLEAFQTELHSKTFAEYDDDSFDTIDEGKGTKDKKVIIQKLDMLEKLMTEFLHIDIADREDVPTDSAAISDEQFIVENVGIDINELREDMDFYNQSLDDLIDTTIKIDSKLLKPENRLSLLAMVVYSYKEDKDLDGWLMEYAKNNNTYIVNQKENYTYMKVALEKHIQFAERQAI